MSLRSQRFKGDPKLEAAAVSDPAHITPGAVGQHVAKIQDALVKLDGAVIAAAELQAARYGPSTAQAVLRYKEKRDIINRRYQTRADDIVGKMTIASLDEAMLEREQQADDLDIEIEGPYALHQPKAPSRFHLQYAVARLEPVAQVAPRRRRVPRRRTPPTPSPPATVLAITGTPQMPSMSFRANVHGADPETVMRTSFDWVLTIEFDAGRCRNGPRRTISFTHRASVLGETFNPWFPVIRGGVMTVAVAATIGGRRVEDRLPGIRIVGTNPSRTDLFAALPNNTLRRIALQESIGGKQFDAAADGGVGACPLWSSDRLGGVGLFQITRPRPTDDEVWNWRSNVAAGLRVFNQKIAAARGYPAQVRRSAGFRRLVDEFNLDRAARHLPALTITLPDFTSGDFDTDLRQLELDAIRGYNGFAGNDGFVSPHQLHEFRVAVAGGRLRVEHIDERARTGRAVWERVPVADRPPSGDPNYVAHVLGQRL